MVGKLLICQNTKTVDEQKIVKANTSYLNRLINGENLLIGSVSLGERSEKVAIVVRRGYDYPFDTYDQETIESIIAYALILFDTTVMIQLLDENNFFN